MDQAPPRTPTQLLPDNTLFREQPFREQTAVRVRVLIVTNAFSVADNLRVILTALGYEVLAPVRSAEDALTTLCSEPVDMVLPGSQFTNGSDGSGQAGKN